MISFVPSSAGDGFGDAFTITITFVLITAFSALVLPFAFAAVTGFAAAIGSVWVLGQVFTVGTSLVWVLAMVFAVVMGLVSVTGLVSMAVLTRVSRKASAAVSAMYPVLGIGLILVIGLVSGLGVALVLVRSLMWVLEKSSAVVTGLVVVFATGPAFATGFLLMACLRLVSKKASAAMSANHLGFAAGLTFVVGLVSVIGLVWALGNTFMVVTDLASAINLASVIGLVSAIGSVLVEAGLVSIPKRSQKLASTKPTNFTSSSQFTPVTPKTCPNCKIKPTALNPATGQYFDHCSRTCATQATLCEQCKRRPKFRDGTKVHLYCGRACAKLAANNGPTPANPPIPKGGHLALLQPASSGSACQIPRCTLPFIHQDEDPSNCHMATHEAWRKRGCISCRAAEMSKASVLCQPCHDTALSAGPVIIEVPEDHRSYKSVEKQFKQSWRHNTTCPDIKAVYKIIAAEAVVNRYQQYLDSVEAMGKFEALGKSRGNEHRRWHGTKRKCNLGDPGNKTFCADSGCSLCCIIETSFDLRYFKAATGWGRFGRGIYTSSTSSKSNDYSKNIGIDSEWKALLLNKVVVGNGKKLTQDSTSLTKPPPGYDSVLAEVVPGGALNYDELVVYQDDAVQPSYLVMYEGS